MVISIAGVIINVIMVLIIIGLVITGIVHNSDLNRCKTQQSAFCYAIQCPCDNKDEGPCFGYAFRPGEKDNEFYCSNSPSSIKIRT